jgi:hypothetical protein
MCDYVLKGWDGKLFETRRCEGDEEVMMKNSPLERGSTQ